MENLSISKYSDNFSALLISMQGKPPASLESFIRQLKASGTAVYLQKPDISLNRFLIRHQLSADELMVISDSEKLLADAKNASIASAGFQRNDASYLTASYLFQDFNDDLPDYLRLAYCRFHRLPFVIAYTSRLIIRETCRDDIPGLLKLYESSCTDSNADTESLRHRFFPAENPDAFLDAYIQAMYNFCQLGMYTIVRKSDGAVIGHCGFDLKKAPQSSGISGEAPFLGYILSYACRRQGYALEACLACLGYLSEQTDHTHVFCNVHRDNHDSLKLAKRLGFRLLDNKNGNVYWLYRLITGHTSLVSSPSFQPATPAK